MTKAVPEELGFLFAGNATLVAVQNRIALTHAWRGGEIAFADGMGFVVPIRTVHAGLNPKYFVRARHAGIKNITELLIVDCHPPCGDLLIAFPDRQHGPSDGRKSLSRSCGWYNSLTKKAHLKGPGDLDSLPARAIRKWAGPDASPALIVRPSAWANPFRPEHYMEHTTGSSNPFG